MAAAMAQQLGQLDARLTSLEAARTADNTATETAIQGFKEDVKNDLLKLAAQITTTTTASQAIEQDLINTKAKVEEVVNRISEVQTQTAQEIKNNFDQAISKIDQTFSQVDTAMTTQGEGFKTELLDIRNRATAALTKVDEEVKKL